MSDEQPKKPIDKVTVAFVAVLLLGAALLGVQQMNGTPVLPEGSVAPDFALDRPDGRVVRLSELRGQVVVVNFWATWCPPCREEIPYLVSTVQDFEKDGVTLVAISNDNLDTQRDAVARFLGRFTQLAPYAALGRPDVSHAYGVKALPSMVVIDREGKVAASMQGQATERQIRRWLEDATGR